MSPYDMNQFTAAAQEVKNADRAKGFYDRLLEMINSFNRDIDNEYEVGLTLSNFGQVITITVTNLGYYNPYLIRFYGHDQDHNEVELIQHISQINVLLIKVKRADSNSPKRPIGFASWKEFDEKYPNIV